MSAKENIHDGHRERLTEKFLSNPDGFSEHELLEMLLFNFIPRKNTNEIAHGLLRHFGSIKNIFSATGEELTFVKGVGEKTAANLILLGKIYGKLLSAPPQKKVAWSNFKIYSEEIPPYFDNLGAEKAVFFFLDAKFYLTHALDFGNDSKLKVIADLPELAAKIALKKPRYVIAAHNHPSGSLLPSKDDDDTTLKLALLCALHGTVLTDHVIVAKGGVYSYRMERKLDALLSSANLNNTYKSLKE